MSPDAGEIVQAYLDSKADWSDEETMQLIFEAAESADSQAVRLYARNRTAFQNCTENATCWFKAPTDDRQFTGSLRRTEETLPRNADAQFQKAFRKTPP